MAHPRWLDALVRAIDHRPDVGMCASQVRFFQEPRLDSAGMLIAGDGSSKQRGHGRLPEEFPIPEETLFPSASAALYRRAMLETIGGFDSRFFLYCEDTDLGLRARWVGWKCLYVPYARGYHVRKVLPGNRRALPPEINMHSVKNRFLMRLKNISGDLYLRNWLSITVRDVLVVGSCLVWEHTSIRAFLYVARNWKRVLAKRRWIQERRRVDDEYIASWFRYAPVSKQGPKKAATAQHSPFSINGRAPSKAEG